MCVGVGVYLYVCGCACVQCTCNKLCTCVLCIARKLCVVYVWSFVYVLYVLYLHKYMHICVSLCMCSVICVGLCMCYVCAVYITRFLGAQLRVSHAC